MSRTARNFLILRNWIDWQDDLTAEGKRPHPWFFDGCAQLRRDAMFLIAIGIDGGWR